jgi:acetyl esterase
MARRANPQLQRVIEVLKAAMPPDAPRLWEVPPAEARRLTDAFCLPLNVGGPTMAETHEIALPGRRGAISARLYVPRGAASPSPGLLFLHGGGFTVGSPDTHDRLTRELAEGLGARAVSIHYGLAPEHPYPTGLHDCVDAARWLGAHGLEVGIDAGQLLIGGDSAGANLTAATLLRLRDDGCGPAFRGALLIYGRYAAGDTPTIVAWGDRDLILSRRLMHWFREQYTRDGIDPNDPYYAPLAADLTGLPPAILVVGTLDPLLSDSEQFAAALEKAGVSTEFHVFEDGIHAFLQMPMLDITTDAIEKLCAFGRQRLTSPAPGARPGRP